jgi:hypothetical protein
MPIRFFNSFLVEHPDRNVAEVSHNGHLKASCSKWKSIIRTRRELSQKSIEYVRFVHGPGRRGLVLEPGVENIREVLGILAAK